MLLNRCLEIYSLSAFTNKKKKEKRKKKNKGQKSISVV